MQKRHEGIVITGASSGIGAATAVYLSKIGFRVCGTVRHEEDGVYLRAAGVTPLVMDVTDPESVALAVDAVDDALCGVPLFGLVNNAGVPCAGPLELVPLDRVKNVFDVNVMGCLHTTRAFLPQLKQNAGRIVNMSSVSALTPLPFIGPYAASKAALEALTHSLRREVAPFDVCVTIVRPGSIQTRVWDVVEAMDTDYLVGTAYDGVARRMGALAVSGGRRGMRPHSVAQAVAKVLTCTRPPVAVNVVRSRFKSMMTRALPVKLLDEIVRSKVWEQRQR